MNFLTSDEFIVTVGIVAIISAVIALMSGIGYLYNEDKPWVVKKVDKYVYAFGGLSLTCFMLLFISVFIEISF